MFVFSAFNEIKIKDINVIFANSQLTIRLD